MIGRLIVTIIFCSVLAWAGWALAIEVLHGHYEHLIKVSQPPVSADGQLRPARGAPSTLVRRGPPYDQDREDASVS